MAVDDDAKTSPVPESDLVVSDLEKEDPETVEVVVVTSDQGQKIDRPKESIGLKHDDQNHGDSAALEGQVAQTQLNDIDNGEVLLPPRTPQRIPLAPRTPGGHQEGGSRPVTGSEPKPQTQLEKLRTVAYERIAKIKKLKLPHEKIQELIQKFHKSSLGIALIRLDYWLEKKMAHGHRYFMFLFAFQLFPILFFMFRITPTVRRKCDKPLDIYIIGSGIVSMCRCMVGFMVMQRILNRDWPGQIFGEALGQVWNMVEKQGNIDDSFVGGIRLNILICFIILLDYGFWLFGFLTLCVSNSAICADRITLDAVAVVVYQFFNLFFMSAYIDIVLPYFYLEFDPDVDVHVAGVKNSSGDAKRKMKINMEKKARAAAKEKERVRKRTGGTKIHPVEHEGEIKHQKSRPTTAWWESEDGMPPRKKIITGKEMGDIGNVGRQSKKSKGKSGKSKKKHKKEDKIEFF